jgi:NADP-reducing hydrogenase subunit HndB
MISAGELADIRLKTLDRIKMNDNKDAIRIVVGMATCGIAAGAKPVYKTLSEELKKRNVKNVELSMTGCIGVCRLEPMVEIFDHEGTRVTYVNMTAEKAARVVAEHLSNGRVCIDYTIGAAEVGK